MARGQPISDAARNARAQNLRAGREARQAAMRRAALDRRDAGKKTCSRCLRILPLAAFYPAPEEWDGAKPGCKTCTRARRREIARAKQCTPLPGWLTKCCSSPLLDDPELGWWRVVHRLSCRDRWQPDRASAGGVWEWFHGRPVNTAP